jgi:hypothetical protein
MLWAFKHGTGYVTDVVADSDPLEAFG